MACAPRSPASSDRSWAHLTLRKRPLRCWDCGAARPASSFRRRLNEAVTTSGSVSADDGDSRDHLEKSGAVALPHTRSREPRQLETRIHPNRVALAGWLAGLAVWLLHYSAWHRCFVHGCSKWSKHGLEPPKRWHCLAAFDVTPPQAPQKPNVNISVSAKTTLAWLGRAGLGSTAMAMDGAGVCSRRSVNLRPGICRVPEMRSESQVGPDREAVQVRSDRPLTRCELSVAPRRAASSLARSPVVSKTWAIGETHS